MKRCQRPKRPFERLIPWLVEVSDLRRYLGRAVDRCERGGTVFFYHRRRTGPEKGQKHLLALVPYGLDEKDRMFIFARFHMGQHKTVKLAAIKQRRVLAMARNRK